MYVHVYIQWIPYNSFVLYAYTCIIKRQFDKKNYKLKKTWWTEKNQP